MAHSVLIVFSEIGAVVWKPLEDFPGLIANNVACFIGVALASLSQLAEEICNAGSQTSSMSMRNE